MIPELKRIRECGECNECCSGTLSVDIYGKFADKGIPCHFLAKMNTPQKRCTIYPNRPDVCVNYRCEWVKDDSTNIPEWMRPDLSKVIITSKVWGNNIKNTYWLVTESNKKIDSNILNWIYMYTSEHNIFASIEVNGRFYQKGSLEFSKYLQTMR